MKNLLIAMIFTSLQSICIAQTWVRFAVNGGGDSFYYDSASVVKMRHAVKFTFLANYKESLKLSNGIALSETSTRIIDCQVNRQRMVNLIAYKKRDAKGHILKSKYEPNPPWEKIENDSVINEVRNKFCELKFKAD